MSYYTNTVTRRTPRRPMTVRRSLALVGATTALLLSGTGIASADQIYNSLDGSIDSTAEIMPLNVGGTNGTTTLAVNKIGTTGSPTDGKAGCNLTGNTTLTVSVNSSNPSVATVSPSSVTFTSCSDTHQLTVSPVAQGSTTVSLSQVSNDSGGSFDLAPATFTVNVTAPAPSNSAPSVVVRGVSDGASYNKGSVPDATCEVTDAEDGPSSFPATLSDVTGPDAIDGIGSQTASCDYTDQGGTEASSSATYNIVDASAPVITYTLDPASPDGHNGWYTGEVKLTWNVSEPESPNSLSTTGCADQDITADQVATEYTCSASSAGGDATPMTVTIQRDGNGPVVSYGSFVSGTPGNNGWYTSDVTVSFNATDDFSGPASASANATSSGEGDNVTIDSPAFTDNAGNTTPAGTVTSPGFKIDKSAPDNVTFVGGPADGGSYYYGSVPSQPTCTADDSVSGLASCVVTGDANPNAVGHHTWTATATDKAGNIADAVSIGYTVLAWTDTGFYNPVNMGGTLNTVKAGSTVPLKFNVYAGSELTDTGVVKSFTSKSISCSTLDVTGTDPVEFTTTGGTSLRYDSTGFQFVQNWKTPTGAGSCYVVTMTTQDGSSLSANFKLK